MTVSSSSLESTSDGVEEPTEGGAGEHASSFWPAGETGETGQFIPNRSARANET